MKKVLKTTAVIGFALGLNACATSVPAGFISTNLTFPITATSISGDSAKTGTAVCKSYLSMIATGDCSIDAAKKNGGITTVNHVDWHASNFLGLVGTYTLQVYGN